MSTEKRPRGVKLIAGREPLLSFDAWLLANRGRFKPGSVNQILITYDYCCRYPWGEPCTCPAGPEIKVASENPRNN